MVRLTAATLVVLATLATGAQTTGTFSGRVVGVLDGDSLKVLHDGREVDIRLYGVDAPERAQAFGSVAKRALSTLVFGKTVTVHVVDVDRYGRSVSRIDVDGHDVGLEMIRGGFAWHYKQYSSDAGYAAAERDARLARRGLWQDAAPVAPWDFRRQHSTQAAPSARTTSRGLAAQSGPSGAGPFHGNVNSHVFHAPGCKDYACKNCTAEFATYAAAVAAGYRPHAACVKR